MHQTSSFPFSLHFNWPRVRIPQARWLPPALMAMGLALGLVLGLVTDRYAPADAIAEEVPVATSVPYVSSDPSVPPADSVKFPEPEPLSPTF